MEKIKEWAPTVLAIVTLLLVTSLKMDSCQMKKAHAKVTKVEKHQKAEQRGQRGSRRGRVAPRGDRGHWQQEARTRPDKAQLEAIKERWSKRGDSKSAGAWKKREKKIN